MKNLISPLECFLAFFLLLGLFVSFGAVAYSEGKKDGIKQQQIKYALRKCQEHLGLEVCQTILSKENHE